MIFSGLTNYQRQLITQAMGELMTSISERCVSSGWPDNWQDELPSVCYEINTTRSLSTQWGLYELHLEEAQVLIGLAEALGHWVTLADVKDNRNIYAPYDIFGQWIL